MAKLRLQIEDLRVDTFDTGSGAFRRGTVHGESYPGDVQEPIDIGVPIGIGSGARSCAATECDATCIGSCNHSCNGSCATCEGTCHDPTCWPSSPHICC